MQICPGSGAGRKAKTVMTFEEKNILLKDGRSAVFRSPRTEDAAEMVEYLRAAAGQTEYLANYPEEIRYTEESEKVYLRNCLEDENALMIVCIVDGKLAGNCQIVFQRSIKTKHRATVMIALLEEYWGLGIGSAMFAEMEAAARSLGTAQLELEMVEGNERALRLYRKMGFTVVGQIPDAYRLRSGRSCAAVFMTKKL